MKTNAALIWFRQDLRLEDNPAFEAALEKKTPIIPLYIYAPHEEKDWAPGGATKWWLHHSLVSLNAELKEFGLNLIITKGDSQKILLELIEQFNVTAVYWNRRYEPMAIKRDSSVKELLHGKGIEVKSFNGNLLYEPWTIKNKQGNPFQVFTPFWKTCLMQGDPSQPTPYPKIPTTKTVIDKALSVEDLELLPQIHWDKGIQASWKPGAQQAKKILADFIKNSIEDYKTLRDRPDLPGVSHLSPYLHFGEISPRMIWHTIQKQADTSNESVQGFLRQLGWREFAHHLLYHFPKTPSEPLRQDFSQFPWNDNPEYLKAWQKGLTGYPIVDAGMRELWTTGWMHNRVRMIVGSFLVKDLMIDWQRGAEWFWDTLVDADLANNTLGWQWVGGCGADAAPYFRIFNPITQGEKFDPDGAYVRKWVPEIARLPNKYIHKPWEAPELILKANKIQLGMSYPFPIVDHSEARNKALEAFKALRD